MDEAIERSMDLRLPDKECRTVSDLCNEIWKIESEFNTLYRATTGFYPWPALRMSIYYSLSELSGVLEKVEWSAKLARLRILTSLLPSRRTPEEVRLASARGHYDKTCDLFIISNNPDISHRSFAIAKPVAERALDQGKSVVMASDYCDDVLAQRPGFSRLSYHYLNRKIALGYAANRLNVRKAGPLTKEDREFWTSVGDAASKRIAPDFSLLPMIERQLNLRKILGPIFGSVFDWFSPSEIAVVCHYGQSKAIWIDEARKRGISVTDIQHGTMSKYHLGI